MLIIPAIDLRDGKCVRLTQGRREEVKVYDGEAVGVAKGFEEAGARMLHVVDLDGAFADRNAVNRKVVRGIIRAVGIPVQFGGGLRSVTDVPIGSYARRDGSTHYPAHQHVHLPGQARARRTWDGVLVVTR